MDTENLIIPEGLKYLIKGYVDYAKEVVIDRAIPGIDGLKPSQRRILYTMKHIEKVKDLTKCQAINGATLKLHPHGDAAVYATLVRMVDSSETMNVPYLKGKGSFSKVYLTESPAAPRYTEVMLNNIAEEFFGEMQGVKSIPSYDNKLTEPELLPVSFPSILANPVSGIAVGLASNIPAFNFNELNSAVIELIETGDIAKPLVPDYSTYGEYVMDEIELRKIMETGKGRLKLRGKWHIDKKSIVITEIPYYTNLTEIEKSVKDIQGVMDTRDETDKNGLRFVIECSNRKMVESVLTEVLKLSRLQMVKTTNIVVIIDNQPKELGVKQLLSEWVNFRKGVLQKQLSISLENATRAIGEYEVLVKLLENEEYREEFLTLLVKKGHGEARNYLFKIFPDVKSSVVDWILGMSLRSISGLQSKIKHLEGLKEQKATIENDLADLGKVIVKELKNLNATYSFPRKTQATDVDYVFETGKEKVKVEPVPVVVGIDGKFIKKLKKNSFSEKYGFTCMSNDIISFIDTKGRLLRVALENLDFTFEAAKGTYLPNYLEVEDDFEIMTYEIIDEKTVGYIYADGYASVVDYSEWVDGQRCTRVTNNGVSPLASSIRGEIDLSKSYAFVQTAKGKIGFITTDFKQKNRTARTKLVSLSNGDEIIYSAPVEYMEVIGLVKNLDKFVNKVSFVNADDNLDKTLYEDIIGRV